MTIPHTTERFRLTDAEIAEERSYRINERLGILCGAGVPTDGQMALAIKEADEWVFDYFRNLT